MIAAPTYNLQGKTEEKTKLRKEIFEKPSSPTLMAQAVRVYLANQRRARAKTKTRGEVAKTTAKMYRQKGTGRARHGSFSAPIFAGGGVAHGPTGKQNWALVMPKKMRQAAIRGVLSERAKQKQVVVLTGGDQTSGKTKEGRKLLEKIGNGRLVLVVAQNQGKLARAWRNIEGVEVVDVGKANTYQLMRGKMLVLTAEAINDWGKKYAD